MKVPSPDFLALLRTMVEHGVDFIIVGGVSAVLHGAPITTFDLDWFIPAPLITSSTSFRPSGTWRPVTEGREIGSSPRTRHI